MERESEPARLMQFLFFLEKPFVTAECIFGRNICNTIHGRRSSSVLSELGAVERRASIDACTTRVKSNGTRRVFAEAF